MDKKADYLVTFHATSDAMRAEKCCSGEKLQAHLRPVPRELSSSCGLALEAASVKLEKVKKTLTANKIDVEAICLKEEDYKKLE